MRKRGVNPAYSTVRIGPAWWFNDSRLGIANQLKRVAAVDLLANPLERTVQILKRRWRQQETQRCRAFICVLKYRTICIKICTQTR